MWLLTQSKRTLINTDRITSIWIDQASCSVRCRADKENVYILSTYKTMDEAIKAFNDLLSELH